VPPSNQEGRARFQVGAAFYRPKSKIARDLALLAAAVYRQRNGRLRVLDAMAGCGVRALRYHLEAGADELWVNEGNPELASLLAENLAASLVNRPHRLTYQDANEVFFDCYQRRDFYDLVDIDNFGSPAPHAASGLAATRIGGLLYITSTDGRATGGHDSERALASYGAYPRAHPAAHEQGLRLLIGHAAQQAAARGLGAEPVFSLFTGQVHRAMVRLVPKSTLTAARYGFLTHCHRCGQFGTAGWRQLGQVSCACAPDSSPVLSGPLWLGPLHHQPTLTAMEAVAADWGWHAQGQLLKVMQAEADLPPYYYRLGEIGRRGKLDIPPRDCLLTALRPQFRASPTHLEGAAIKTDAPLATVIAVARQLQTG